MNCLVCSDKRILYAGDSKGQLGVWQEKQGAWQMKKAINIVNVSICFFHNNILNVYYPQYNNSSNQGAPLVSLSLHPSGRKMLLHTDKGQLVMLDLRM